MPNERRNSTLTRVMKLCLAFPEATLEHKHAHVAFAVRGKTFVYYLDDHHGDGIVSACFKVGPGENAELVRAEPDRYYMPAYIGPRGWVALRLDVGAIDWGEVLELATQSYRRVAPKRLVERAFTRGSK